MSGTLYVVATPIGNLEDITLRALRVLREVDLVAAEDTRRTAKLLHRYSITTPTTSFHAHNEWTKAQTLLHRLEAGQSIALVADAGTPTVLDPGARLIALALDSGIPVDVIPGPSAVITALVASGFSPNAFTFAGFPPARAKARARWLESFAHESHPLVMFEAPHRIEATLTDILRILGDRPAAVLREMTKVHGQVLRGTLSEILKSPIRVQGEFTLVIGPPQQAPPGEILGPSDVLIGDAFGHLTESGGFTRREAIRELARRHGIPSRAVYAAIERGRLIGRTTK